MRTDIVALRQFYASPLGRFAARSISMSLTSVWNPLPNERLVGLGYAVPYLERFGGDAERTLAFMPAAQGGVAWPSMRLSFDQPLSAAGLVPPVGVAAAVMTDPLPRWVRSRAPRSPGAGCAGTTAPDPRNHAR